MRGTSALGWRGSFGCPMVTGDAVFIPSRGAEASLRAGAEISVDTGYESVEDVQLVLGTTQEYMRGMEDARDYLVGGPVVFVAPLGNIQVSVRGLIFTLERGDLDGLDPQVGDFLHFELHGLTLWDKGPISG